MTVPLIPDSAPFTPRQRAWLNGFFAGLLNIDPVAAANEHRVDSAIAVASGTADVAPSCSQTDAEDIDSEDPPWHDSSLSMDERLAMAEDRPVEDQLMASMAQLDCGACGYLCRTYSRAIADGSETDLTRCVPGGKDTAKMLKKLVKLQVGATGPAHSTSAGGNGGVHADTETAQGHADVAVLDRPVQTMVTAEVPITYGREHPFPSPMLECRKLSGDASEKDVRFVSLDLRGSGLTYEVGDAIGLYAKNCYEQTDALIRLMGYGGGETVRDPKGQAKSLREAMIHDFDIAVASDAMLELLAGSAGDRKHAALLEALIDGESVEGLLEDARLIDIVARFPSARPTAASFAGALKPIQPRLYSIASSQKLHPQQVHLTVGVVRYEQNGQPRKGLASTFLADRLLPREPVHLYVQPSHGFKLTGDSDAPIIMVGPGTGIAPFRAFLQERQVTGAKGKNWLLFGDQRQASDFLYRDELESYVEDGVLNRLDTAFSRDQTEKIYVQHRMLENAEALWRWLQDGACFYVCGDAKRMARDVDSALKQIVKEQGGMSVEDAAQYVKQLASNMRYQRDVY